ncbi:MAG: tyrosine-type recombinase/integrase [Planctomycetota bacterium]|nr:tyrosine-type recombinase/integrase [Planctomycetota bacterium]
MAGKESRNALSGMHLSPAIRNFFDARLTRHAVLVNPALAVKGPRLKIRKGKTLPLMPKQARKLVKALDTSTVVGLRDRAAISILIYTGARVGAIAELRVKDFYTDGQQYKFHFEEKGDTSREIPCRQDLEDILHDYMGAAGIGMDEPEAPLFRTSRGRSKKLTDKPMTADDMYRMVKRRFRDAGLPAPTFSCHSFQAGAATDLIGRGVSRKDVQRLVIQVSRP